MANTFFKTKLEKFAKPILDLVIVITGVSVAFILNNWNESKKENAERVKILTSLKTELQSVKKYFPDFASYQQDRIKEWDSLQQLGQLADFYNYRYIQPQYNYEIVSYALETRNNNIIDFRLHAQLMKIYNSIKGLEQAEIYMTEIALQYQPVPSVVGNPTLQARNAFLFSRFITFGRDRASHLKLVTDLAEETLPLLEVSKATK
jgi:hypothetical protein